MCRNYRFFCPNCKLLTQQHLRPCLTRSCKHQTNHDHDFIHPVTPPTLPIRCPLCWSHPFSQPLPAFLPRILTPSGYVQTKDITALLAKLYHHLKTTTGGDYLISTNFTPVPDLWDMMLFCEAVSFFEMDLMFRYQDGGKEQRKPDKFEEELVAKLVYAKFSEWVDEMELLRGPQEERTELIVECGKLKAKREATKLRKAGRSLDSICFLCTNPYCTEEEDSGDFEFLQGFEGESIVREFDLAAFLDDKLGEEDCGGEEEQPCMTPCKHVFGHRCLRKWLKTRTLMPFNYSYDCSLCRASFGALGRIEAQYRHGKNRPLWLHLIMGYRGKRDSKGGKKKKRSKA